MLTSSRSLSGTSQDLVLTQLLGAISNGDEKALRAIYDLTSPKLYGIILRIQHDRSAAEDVLQEVYLRIWQAAGSYAPAQGGPISWLCTIARNRAIDTVRRQSKVRDVIATSNKDWIDSFVDHFDSEENIHSRNALRFCLDQLNPAHIECVILAYCQGFSREELANYYNHPVNTIKTQLRRSLASLKLCLEGL